MNQNKRVVVTGSRGFVAHHTIPVLERAGYEVLGFDLVDGQDICRADDIRKVLTRGCKVLNLAAVSRFAHADRDPAEAYRVNVGGVAVLFQVAAEVGVERVVHASSGSVYMPVWQSPITEDHPVIGANSHYSRSKALGEEMIGRHRVPYVVLRYSHLYGEGKWHGGLVDSFLERIARGAAPVLYGGKQSNDFCYVPDVARANLRALETTHLNERINIGTGEPTTTDQAADIISELTGYKGPVDRQPLRGVDTTQFVLDVRKAWDILRWTPEWSFKQGLTDMIKWRKQ